MFEQVLDLDGDIVGQSREFAVECADDVEGVARTVEEIRVAEGDVLRAGGDLTANVLEHDLGLDNSELAVIDGDEGAVAAHMLAAAAGFRVSDDLCFAVRQAQFCVAAKRRQTAPVGHKKLLPRERDHGGIG